MKLTIKTSTILLTVLTLIFTVSSYSVTTLSEEVFTGHQLIDDWSIKEAESFTDILIKKYPKSGDAYFLKARVEFSKGNYKHAIKILNQVGDSHSKVLKFKKLVHDTYEVTKSFITKESDHFIYRFQQGPDEVLIHYAIEVLEKSYTVLGQLLNYYPEEKVLVEFYPNRDPFSKVSPLTMKDIETSGTVALCKYNRIMIISPGSLLRGYNWMDTLSHEYIHYLLTKKSRNNLPLWMHEGIAKYFEVRWRNGEEYLTPIMETILAGGLQNNYLIPLDKMMPSLAKLETAEDVQLAYAEVSTMIEYLIQVKGDEVISVLLEKLANGKPFDQVLPNILKVDLYTFQDEWKQYAKRKELKIIPGLKPPAILFKVDRSSQELYKENLEIHNQQSQDLAFLGDILKSRNFHKAAIIEYQRAIDQSKIFSPVLHNKLAKTFLVTKDYDKAEILLEKCLSHYPMFHTTLVNIGELYFNANNIEKSRDFYERAIRVNPFNPFTHSRLMTIYQKLGQNKEKELQAKLFQYIN